MLLFLTSTASQLDPITLVKVTWSVLAMALVVNPVNAPVAEAMFAAAASPEAPLASRQMRRRPLRRLPQKRQPLSLCPLSKGFG